VAGAQAFAIEQHGRFVLLALANDDDAIHLDRIEHQAHGVHGGLVAAFFIAPPHKAPGGQSGGLGHTDQLQCQIAVRLFRHRRHFPRVEVDPCRIF
jgi:hypothetical protein